MSSVKNPSTRDLLFERILLCFVCLCAAALLAFSIEGRLYQRFVHGAMDLLPGYYMIGNNLHEFSTSVNLLTASALQLVLSLLWLTSTRRGGGGQPLPAKMCSAGIWQVFHRIGLRQQDALFLLGSLLVYVQCGILESKYGEGPLVQVFCWPFVMGSVMAVLRLDMRPGGSSTRAWPRKAILLLLPSLLLIVPYWITLLVQFALGLLLAVDVALAFRESALRPSPNHPPLNAEPPATHSSAP